MTERDVDFRHDRRLDEFLTLDASDTEAVANLLTPALDANRRRARKVNETHAFNRTIGLVVANALVAGEQRVHYSRRYEDYSGSSPYRPCWLGSKRLLGVIDGLEREGLLEASSGRWDSPFSKGVRSSFVGMSPLTEELAGLGVDLRSVQRDRASAYTILLKDERDRLIRYDPSDERIVQQAEELRTYNAFLAAQEIGLASGDDAPPFGDLTRIYNGEGWERGGRHFGGWWQRVGSAKRSDILINREKTVELDYGGFNTRALYHLTGQEMRGEDPYDIPKIRELIEGLGIDWGAKGRDSVKRMQNIAIGAKSKNAFFSDESKEEICLPDNIIRECVQLLLDYHSPIRDHLFKGKSLELMKLESDICQNIICRGVKDGITILPIFDSFITTDDNEKYLSRLMIEEYKCKVGHIPTIH